MDLIIKNRNYTVEYISDARGLGQCVEYLATTSEFAFDLEFDRNRYKYGFNLCLIQIASAKRCFVIDPLEKIGSLNSLFQLFENPKILKIVHSSGEDMRLLQLLGCYPKNIFDTETAARLLDYEHTSLARMLESKFGVVLDKSEQKSNWNLRPLSLNQIKYCSNDVVYLLELKALLEAQLNDKNLLPFLADENHFLSHVRFEQESGVPVVSYQDRQGLSDYQQYLLLQLLIFREQTAKQASKPASQLINTTTLRQIVTGEISIDDWTELGGIFWRIKTTEFRQKIADLYFDSCAQADKLELSKEIEKKRLSEQEYLSNKEKKIRHEQEYQDKFRPIQNRLSERYGVFAARFMCSTNLINEIIKKDKTISEIMINYRINLIFGIAAELGIDLDEYR